MKKNFGCWFCGRPAELKLGGTDGGAVSTITETRRRAHCGSGIPQRVDRTHRVAVGAIGREGGIREGRAGLSRPTAVRSGRAGT